MEVEEKKEEWKMEMEKRGKGLLPSALAFPADLEADLEEDFEEEEIGKTIMRMKKRKATGYDGIFMEMQIFGDGAVKKGLTEG